MLELKRTGKKGTWQISGSYNGQRIRKSTGTRSEEHARKIKLDLEQELLDRHVWGEEKTTVFAEAVVLYLEKGGEARFMNPLLERFGTMRLADITDMMVSQFCIDRYPNCGREGLNRQVYTPLIAVYRKAAKAGLCTPKNFTRPIAGKKKKRALLYATDEQLAMYLPECGKPLKAASLLLSFSGARASEACRLHDTDVDWDRRTAILRETKNGKPRQIVLPAIVYDALVPLRGTRGPLFGFSSRYSLNQAIERAIDRVNRNAGAIRFKVSKDENGKRIRERVILGDLAMPYMTSHNIGRHAFAARLLKQGKTLKEVQHAGGWESYRMVADTYGHLEQSSVDDAVRSSDKELAKLLTPAKNVVALRI